MTGAHVGAHVGAHLGVDLGKTGCRVLLRGPDGAERRRAASGAVGLAEPGGATDALRAVLAVLDDLGPTHVTGAAVGAAGATAAPAAARELAASLSRALAGAPVAVTSDAITSHLGALGGRPGAVVAAGTGAVAVGVGADGEVVLVDGWGQWLGDDGSGSWVGREALRAVLRALDGRGPGTSLAAAARRRFGDLDQLPAAVAAEGSLARTTASFAPDVVATAQDGDAVAADLLRRAALALAESGVTAARRVGATRAALVGGLRRWGPVLLEPWEDAVAAAGLEPVEPAGDALDGALALAQQPGTELRGHVLRETTREERP